MGTTPSKGSGKPTTGPKLLNLSVQTPPLTSLEHLAANYGHYLTPSLTALNVSHNSLSSLPPSLFTLVPNLETLNLSGNILSDTLPVTLPSLKNLRELSLSMNRFTIIPEPVFYLSTSLATLEIPSNELTEISEKISLLVNLTRLDISSNHITTLPDEIGSLTNLVYLRARANKIATVTPLLGQLTNLITLDLRQNEIEELDAKCFPASSTLEKLLLTENYLRSIPDSIIECTGVAELDLAENKLTQIPPLTSMTGLKRLMLNDNRLTDVPLLDDMHMLRELDLRTNQLTSLENLRNCSSLQLLSVRDNNLMTLPKSIGLWKNLEEFDASVNLLEEIPEEIGNISPLTRLYLSDNHISDVPNCLTKLTNLKLLGLAYNDLDDESFRPQIWAGFTSLIELRLLGNKLSGLPRGFHTLPKIDRLFIGYNEFVPHGSEHEPPSFRNFEMTQLGIGGNPNLGRIPDSLLATVTLRKLWMGDCGLKKLPGAIADLHLLEVLDLSNNKLTKLPKKICLLSCLIELLVPHNDLAKLPSDMDKLNNLQLLDVSWNPKLNKFPAGLARINGLLQVKALYCSIDELPEPWMAFTTYPPPPPPLNSLLLASEKPPAPTGLQLKWLAIEGNPIDGYTLPNFVKFRVDQELRGVAPKSRPRVSDLRTRLSVEGAPGSGRKSLEEPTNPASIPVDSKSARLAPIPEDAKCFYDLNISEMQGVRPTMEDAFLVQDHRGIVIGPHTFELLAIFDGHADAACAEFCATHMHDILQQELSYALQPKESSTSKVALLYKGGDSPTATRRNSTAKEKEKEINGSGSSKKSKKAAPAAPPTGDHAYDYFRSCVKHGLRNTFKRMNDCIDEYDIQSGCTVALALFCGNDAWFVSCGDARITLNVGDRPIRATVDHKASDREERHRIQALGGYITDGGRIMGMIAVARSLGDRAFRPYVAYTPSVKWMKITEDARFAIIACDGLWDVVSDEFAIKVVSDYYRKHGTYQGSALMLRESAYALGSGDNISTMVVGLKPATNILTGPLTVPTATASAPIPMSPSKSESAAPASNSSTPNSTMTPPQHSVQFHGSAPSTKSMDDPRVDKLGRSMSTAESSSSMEYASESSPSKDQQLRHSASVGIGRTSLDDSFGPSSSRSAPDTNPIAETKPKEKEKKKKKKKSNPPSPRKPEE